MNARWDVLGFGAVSVDDLIYVDQYPPLNTKTEVRARQRQGGGLAGTALVAAARLGARAAYCGVLGQDELSRFTIEALEREGIDCSRIFVHPEARPLHATIIVDLPTGQRSILFSLAGTMEPPLSEITAGLIGNCRVLFVDYTVMETALHAAALARQAGIPVVADIEGSAGPRLALLLPQVDHLILGCEMAGLLTGEKEPAEMARRLAEVDRACSVVTAGEQGCWYVERDGQPRHFPAYPVPVIDTTGCGDVFHGAYAAALARGQAVPECIRLASAAAALKATHPGGREGCPTLEQLQKFVLENPYGN